MTDYHEPQLEVDAVPDYSDSASAIESETFSVTSSVNQYFEQHGRRYHMYFGPDKNVLPTDDKEQKRMDVVHEIVHLITNGKLYHAPLDNRAQRVLDLGTGSGIWAVEYAQEHPHAEVLGVDLSPTQPAWVPSNCRFELDDFELEWTYSSPFDFIHARTITQSVKDWPKLLAEVMRNLTPGGWFELGEWGFEHRSDDNTIPANWAPARTLALLREAFAKAGYLNPEGDNLKQLLLDAGFQDVRLKMYKQPIGLWPKNPRMKDAGALYTVASETGYEAYTLALCTRVLGVPAEEIIQLAKSAYEAHLDRKAGVHAYMPYYVVYGRKPQ